MFTGIIKEKGIVKSIGGSALSISARNTGKTAYIGQSISVNGFCLTVKKIAYPVLFFDFTPATRLASALKYLKISEEVNIEPALAANSDISGHFVLGHVDGIGRVTGKKKAENSVVTGIKIINSTGDDIKRYIIKKGSISVDGISLTVNDIFGDIFSVSIIPLTYEETNLKNKRAGEYVNLESDIIEKTVVNRLDDTVAAFNGIGKTASKGGLTYEFLSENGFL